MFALLCKPIAVPQQMGNPVLRARDCRIAYMKPSQVQEGVLELEILEAPPIVIDPNLGSTDS
jgi:hypothetical protein